jgi:hypothetical protein
MTSLNVLLKDMVKLKAELGCFEIRFGVKSEDFYAAMMRGDLQEFDALDEYRMAFVEWLALYETWLSFDNKYRQLIALQPVALQIKANLDPALAATDPHHKHIPPDIKHHRIPAPDLSLTTPNLPFLIREIEQLLEG